MVGVPYHGNADADLLGFLNHLVHRQVGRNLPHVLVGVDQNGPGQLPDHLGLLSGNNRTILDHPPVPG